MTLVDEVLEGLRLKSTVFSRMTLSGDWGFAKDALSGAPFHLVLRGEAWLRTEGGATLRLGPGDVVVLPRGEAHELLGRPAAEAIPFRRVLEEMGWTHWTPGVRFKTVDLRFGEGEPSTTLITGVFAFGDLRRNPLLGALPSTLLMRAAAGSAPAAAMEAIIALLDAETAAATPGAESLCIRLADILFIQVVRHYLASSADLPRGWLRGMADPEIAPALALMHREPERAWSVASLARAVCMSRSRFAARFQEVVGSAPLEYLTQWRMYEAAGRLAEGRIGLPALASSVGYRSEISFSKAFKRWIGRSPAEYRRWLSRSRSADSEVLARPVDRPVEVVAEDAGSTDHAAR